MTKEAKKIIICPKDVKFKIYGSLNMQDELYNCKFMTIEELYNEVTFPNDRRLLYYTFKHAKEFTDLSVSIDIADMYLRALKMIYFVDEEKCKKMGEKKNFDFLKLKAEINKQRLYGINNIAYYKKQDMEVIGYSYLPQQYLDVIKLLAVKYESECDENIHKARDVYKFLTVEDEISYLAERIITLIQAGTNINKIKIAGANKDHLFLLRWLFSKYHIPLTISREVRLFDIATGRRFLKSIREDNMKDFLNALKEESFTIYGMLIDILNKYTFIDNNEDLYLFMKWELKKTYVNENETDTVRLIDLLKDEIGVDDYVFVIGFNEGEFPKVKKDIDFFGDEDLEELDLVKNNCLKDVNKYLQGQIILKLNTIGNLYISYPETYTFAPANPSIIIKDENYNIIAYPSLQYTFSSSYNDYILACYYNQFENYHIVNPALPRLKKTNPDICAKFHSFKNKFGKIDPDYFRENVLKNKLTLSYTVLNDFFACPFRYYLKYCLKVDIFDETLDLKVGSLYHNVLEKIYDSGFDFEEEFKKAAGKVFPDPSFKEKFILKVLKDDLAHVVKSPLVRLLPPYINYPAVQCERNEKIKNLKDANGCKISLKDRIDKIFISDLSEQKKVIAVLDYKTGEVDSKKTELENLEYGLNSQLPIYIYLLTKNSEGLFVGGFYYQQVLYEPLKKVKYDDKYKLYGYTTGFNCPEMMFTDVAPGQGSMIINGLKRNKDSGYHRHANVITEECVKKIIEATEKKINEAIDSITKGEFPVSPLKVIGRHDSCEYCKFKDLCYKTSDDYKTKKGGKDCDGNKNGKSGTRKGNTCR